MALLNALYYLQNDQKSREVSFVGELREEVWAEQQTSFIVPANPSSRSAGHRMM